MFGFSPHVPMRQNLEHGKQLLLQCNEDTVAQVNEWWQNRNTYYAFESKEGALWWGSHGGPEKFCTLLASKIKYKEKRNKILSPLGIEVQCYSCESKLDIHKQCPFTICRCPCGSKFVHKKCFMPKSCPICGVEYAKTHHETKIINKIA